MRTSFRSSIGAILSIFLILCPPFFPIHTSDNGDRIKGQCKAPSLINTHMLAEAIDRGAFRLQSDEESQYRKFHKGVDLGEAYGAAYLTTRYTASLFASLSRKPYCRMLFCCLFLLFFFAFFIYGPLPETFQSFLTY